MGAGAGKDKEKDGKEKYVEIPMDAIIEKTRGKPREQMVAARNLLTIAKADCTKLRLQQGYPCS